MRSPRAHGATAKGQPSVGNSIQPLNCASSISMSLLIIFVNYYVIGLIEIITYAIVNKLLQITYSGDDYGLEWADTLSSDANVQFSGNNVKRRVNNEELQNYIYCCTAWATSFWLLDFGPRKKHVWRKASDVCLSKSNV